MTTITISKLNQTIRINRETGSKWIIEAGHVYTPTAASRARVMKLVEGVEPKETKLATVYKI